MTNFNEVYFRCDVELFELLDGLRRKYGNKRLKEIAEHLLFHQKTKIEKKRKSREEDMNELEDLVYTKLELSDNGKHYTATQLCKIIGYDKPRRLGIFLSKFGGTRVRYRGKYGFLVTVKKDEAEK